MRAFEASRFAFAAKTVIRIHATCEADSGVLLKGDVKAPEVSCQTPQMTQWHGLPKRDGCHDKIHKEHGL